MRRTAIMALVTLAAISCAQSDPGTDVPASRALSPRTSARLEAASSFWQRVSAESADDSAPYLISFWDAAPLTQVLTVSSDSGIQLDRLFPWLYQDGMSNAITGDWPMTMDELQGSPEEAETLMREKLLEYLERRREGIAGYAAGGDIDQDAASEQIADIRRVRDHLVEVGIELSGFACTCSPAELEAMDEASERISLWAVEPFGIGGSYQTPQGPVDLSI